ncbi:Fur family ferric uptake transcriptional regulator [Desulfobotulus alkaliphilus]|uniref:Fur family ferric uptake transcriptional regulator n=1 Tax=Desulfobotulus alkaliphilus TaxID=622671 RepID=A0A562RJY2_9BACT|nr:transcriptional repressor [Desulfobotulus alkaliphilus]TWI68884.1 Fur family ferric uptake transcriptional regulator [Desulfobotulus alkaliphilus]
MEKKTENKLGAIRLSPQRRLILEEVMGTKKHPTADVIYRNVKHKLPNISLGTVYRNLESLSENGYIQRIDTGTGPRRYDGDTRPHAHIRCTSCDSLEDLPEKNLLEKFLLRELKTDYYIQEVIIEIRGLCPECQQSDIPEDIRQNPLQVEP